MGCPDVVLCPLPAGPSKGARLPPGVLDHRFWCRMSGSDSSNGAPSAGEPFVFPAPIGSRDREEEEEAEPAYVVLCVVSSADAPEVCARLESEGIPCSVSRNRNADGEAESETPPVEILVREPELDLAREVLRRPDRPAQELAEEDEFERWSEERCVENWICPRCRRRSLVLLPLSRGWRNVRNGFLYLLILPVATVLLLSLVSRASVVETLHS